MCGIVGRLWPASQFNREHADALLRTMAAAVAHRGPDASGVWLDANEHLGFAHRRLSIIDLDSRSDQPMRRGANVITFNGEIYNFLELRRDLERRGHAFRTESDTEVILALYETLANDIEAFLSLLRGMFAFALWDGAKRRLLLARDPVGKKPLFYTHVAGGFVFGSEIKALFADKRVPRTVHFPAIDRYLGLGAVAGPETAFQGIYRLPAGSYMVVHPGSPGSEPRAYWNPPFDRKLIIDEHEALDLVERTLDDAVRLRMISDVPLGAFLSGGIDSSLVVALMARHSSSRVKTFTVAFPGSKHDEAEHARRVAEVIGTDHTEIVVEPTPDALDALIWHVDEPFAEYSAVPTWFMSKLVRQHITVALNGDGGDEALAGYELRHRAFLAAERLLIPNALRHGFAPQSMWPAVPEEGGKLHRARKFAAIAFGPGERRHMALQYVFTPNERLRCLYSSRLRDAIGGRDRLVDTYAPIYRDAARLDSIDRELLFSYRLYLPDQLLVKVDRASMAHALEMRSPLLDREFIDLCARLPVDLKIRGRVGKHLLRTLLGRMLPREISSRPKHGFTAPVAAWLRGPLRAALLERTRGSASFTRQYLNPAFVDQMVDDHLAQRRDHPHRLFALLMLELWHSKYIVEDLRRDTPPLTIASANVS